jgi:hypothetical protein
MDEEKTDSRQFSELSQSEQNIVSIMEKRFDTVLNHMGLQTPIDYIFLDFAIQKSRLSLSQISNSLHFLFHTIKKQDLEQLRPFPHAIFIEKYSFRKFFEDTQSTRDTEELVMWSLSPSEKWNSRNILPFTDFHLYFMDVIKPLYNYSAEDIYKLLDERKEDVFFVTHGNRESTESKKIVTLFVTKDHIISFHFDTVDVVNIPQSEKFLSKWISTTMPISLQSLNEFAIFERPKYQLVGNIEESQSGKINLGTPGLDCFEDMDCIGCSS